MKPKFIAPLVTSLVVTVAVGTLLSSAPRAHAVDWFWDADGSTTTATGGTGNWTLAGALWRDGSATGTLTAYNAVSGPNADTAANLVLAGGVDGGAITLSATTSYNLNRITANNSYSLATATAIPTFVGTTPTVSVASGKTLTWGTDLSAASATVTKSGTGIWLFNNTAGQVTSNTTTLDVTAGTLQFDTAGTGANLFTGTGGIVKVGSSSATSLVQTYNGGYVGARSWTLGSKVTLNGGALNGGSTNGAFFTRLTSGTAVQVDAASTIAQSNGGFNQNFVIEGAFTGTAALNLNRANSNTRYLNLKGSMSGYSGNVTIGSTTAAGYVLFGHSSGWGSGNLSLTGSGSRVMIGDEVATVYNSSWTGGSTLGYTAGTFAPSGAITLGASSELSLMNSTASYGILFSPTTGITLNGGTLSAKGTAGTSAFVPATGSTWTVGGTVSSTISGNLQLNNTGVIFDVADSNATGSDVFVSGNTTGTSGFTKNGVGALAFNGTASISGLVTINTGIIQLNGATTKSFTGGVAGAGQLNVGGTGLVTLSGTSTSFTGIVNVGDGAALAGETTINGNLTLGGTTGANLWPDFSTPGSFTANNITLNGVNSIRFTTAPAAGTYSLLKYNGVLSGAGSFSANFRGASINTTGGVGGNEIVLTIGTPVGLVWNNAASTSLWNTGAAANWLNDTVNDFFYDADTVAFNDTPGANQAIVVSGAVSPGSISFTSSNDTVNYSFTGALAGDGISGLTSLVKSGDATVTLGMANTYSGGTTLNEGLLRAANNSALGSGTVTINGGALATDGTLATTLSNPVLLTGNPTLGNTGDTGVLTLSGAFTLSGADRTITTASDATISGAIGGATFGLTKSGGATLTLTGTSTYSSTTVNGGVLQVGTGGTAGVIPTSATITSPGTLRYFRSENGVTLANTFSGNGTLAFRGTGTINQSSYSLTGSNTGLTGTMLIESGARVLVTTAAQLGSAANVTIASGGQLYLNGGTYANTLNIGGNGWTETAGQLGAIRVNGTITGPVVLTGAARLSPYNGTGTISGALSGTDALEINSTAASFTGTLTYSGDGSAFNGPTTVPQGTLNLTGSLGGNLSISSTAFAAGLSGEGFVAGSLTLGAIGRGATLSINPLTSGALTSAGALTLAESGTVVTVNFSTPPASSGTYTVLNHGGITATPANFTLGSAGYRPVTFDTTTDPTKVTMTTTADSLTWKGTTAVWDVNSTSNWKSGTLDPEKFYNLDSVLLDDTATNFAPTLAVTAIPSGVTFNNSANDYTLTGAGGIGGGATLTKSGTSTVTLSTTNTYTGAVTINGGTLRAGSASALGANTGGTTINATGTLDLNAQNLGTEAITLAGGKIINSSATAQQNAFTNLTVTASSVIGGTGRWDVRGATAITTVNSGATLTKEDANLVYLGVNNGSQVVNNGSIQVNAGTLGIWQSTITGSGSFTVNATGALAIEAAVDNTQAVTLAGGTVGNLTGSSASTQSGNITLTANSGIQSAAAGNFNITGNIFESGGSYGITVPSLGGTVTFNGSTGFTGGLILASSNTTDNVATTISLPTGSSLSVAAGKPVQVGRNTGSGAFNAQTLNVAGTVTNSGTLFIGRSGILNVNNGTVWTQNGDMTIAGQGGYTATMNVNSGSSFTYAGANTIKVNPGSSGFGYLYIDGIFTTNRGFQTTVSGGTNYLVTLRSGGTLKLSGNVTDLTTGTPKTQFALGSGGGLIDTDTFSTAISANISGTGNSLTKLGSGTLTLTGTNSYSGPTLLNTGTLAGNGAAGSALTAAANTTLAPGVNIGTFAAAGATLAATSTLAIQIDSTTDTADKLVSTAAVDITDASVTFAEIGSGTIPSGTKLVILDYTGTTLTGTFFGLAEGAPVSVGGNTFTLSYTDSSRVTLTSTTVAPFANWATTNITNINPSAPAGFDDDADGDGYDNGLEWILGGSPLTQDASTLVTTTASASGGLTLSFQRADESIGFASLIVEYDADLTGTWTSLNIASAPPFANGVTVNITPGSPEDTISVNIPASPNAPDGKLFGRIKATQP